MISTGAVRKRAAVLIEISTPPNCRMVRIEDRLDGLVIIDVDAGPGGLIAVPRLAVNLLTKNTGEKSLAIAKNSLQRYPHSAFLFLV